jgi:hypothetical protein
VLPHVDARVHVRRRGCRHRGRHVVVVVFKSAAGQVVADSVAAVRVVVVVDVERHDIVGAHHAEPALVAAHAAEPVGVVVMDGVVTDVRVVMAVGDRELGRAVHAMHLRAAPPPRAVTARGGAAFGRGARATRRRRDATRRGRRVWCVEGRGLRVRRMARLTECNRA